MAPPQTVLPFKLATTNDSITPNAGLAVFAELAQVMSVDELANIHPPKPGSGNGLSPATHVMPIVMTMMGGGDGIAHEFRAGNNNGGRADIIRKAFGDMPAGKKISAALADSEYYASDVIGLIEQRGARFAIAARMDKAVRGVVGSMTDWREYRDSHGVSCGKRIAENVHAMNGGSGSFRLARLRSEREQGDMFEGEYFHHAIATNMDAISAEEVAHAYNGRDRVENVIRELKSGFGLDGVPCGEFSGNAMWFGLGVLTYNLYAPFAATACRSVIPDWRPTVSAGCF